MGKLNPDDIQPHSETYTYRKERMDRVLNEALDRRVRFGQRFPEPTINRDIDDVIAEHVLTHDSIQFRDTVITKHNKIIRGL